MLYCLTILAACSTSVGYVSDTNIVTNTWILGEISL